MTDLPPIKFAIVAEGIDGVTQAFATVEARAQAHAQRMAQIAERKAQKAIANQEKASQKVVAAEEKASQKSAASQAKMAAAKESAKERSMQRLIRQTEKWGRDELLAEKRKNQEIEAESKRSSAARGAFFKGVAGRAGSTIRNVMGTAGRLAGAALAVGGGFGVVDALTGEIRHQGKAKEISLNSMGQASKEDVTSSANRLLDKGFTKDQALSGLEAFIAKTGDAKMAMKTIEDLGDIANATGTDLDHLATTAGEAWNAMSDKEKKAEGPGGLLKMMRVQAAQARVGALDPKDTQGNWGRVFASAAQFEGGTSKNSAYLGALAQASAMGGTSTDAAEATESAKSLALDVQTHKKELAAGGITDLTHGPANQLRDVRTIFEKLMVGTGGDLGKLEKVGINRRSVRLFESPANDYKEAFADAKKAHKTDKQAHQAGLDASDLKLRPLLNANMSVDQVKKESSERTAEVDKQLIIVMEKLKMEVGTALLPEFVKLIPMIRELTPTIVKLLESFIRMAQWVGENPLAALFIGLGAVLSKALAGEIAASGIKLGLEALAGSATTAGIGLVALPAAAVAAFAAAAIAVKMHTDQVTKDEQEEAADPGRRKAREEERQRDLLETRKKRLEDDGQGAKSAPTLFGAVPSLSNNPEDPGIRDTTSQGSEEYQQTIKQLADLKAKREQDLKDAQEKLTGYVTAHPAKRAFGQSRDDDDGAFSGSSPDTMETVKLSSYIEERKLQEAAAEKNLAAAKLNVEAADKNLSAAGNAKGPPKPKTNGGTMTDPIH